MKSSLAFKFPIECPQCSAKRFGESQAISVNIEQGRKKATYFAISVFTSYQRIIAGSESVVILNSLYFNWRDKKTYTVQYMILF